MRLALHRSARGAMRIEARGAWAGATCASERNTRRRFFRTHETARKAHSIAQAHQRAALAAAGRVSTTGTLKFRFRPKLADFATQLLLPAARGAFLERAERGPFLASRRFFTLPRMTVDKLVPPQAKMKLPISGSIQFLFCSSRRLNSTCCNCRIVADTELHL